MFCFFEDFKKICKKILDNFILNISGVFGYQQPCGKPQKYHVTLFYLKKEILIYPRNFMSMSIFLNTKFDNWRPYKEL